MKVLFDHQDPFLLMHGGLQVQIEQTKAALADIGVDVEYLRWWDDTQKADIIHFYGRPRSSYIKACHEKGIRLVMLQLLTGSGSRHRALLKCQRLISRLLQWGLPRMLTYPFNWDAYQLADACIANTAVEKNLMEFLFGAAPDKVHVVPNGVEKVFFDSQPVKRGPWLVCTATITERKRIWELANAAVLAQTPVWMIGKAYSDSDAYASRFMEFARQHPTMVRYEGAIADREKMAEVYRAARGFVLLSTKETRSLSAEEAAACECPLLLSDLPWARSVFGNEAAYCPVTSSPAQTATVLRNFYEKAPSMPPPSKPKSWRDVAHQLRIIYEHILKSP